MIVHTMSATTTAKESTIVNLTSVLIRVTVVIVLIHTTEKVIMTESMSDMIRARIVAIEVDLHLVIDLVGIDRQLINI